MQGPGAGRPATVGAPPPYAVRRAVPHHRLWRRRVTSRTAGVGQRARRLAAGSSPPGGGCSARFWTARDSSVVDVLLVHVAPREAVELLTDLHDVYHPFDNKLGWDYDKTFADGPSYHEGHGRTYEAYGVDVDGAGAAVVVRPDGYIGLVASLDDEGRDKMGRWFDAVLRTAP
ncbi:Phenol 2-monooxygenase [Tolypocladium paradoxum]|uniref:Phenol 2-monooxygenase n=1 Tax=Tolypocladium paradoxum TaxID=94208 RepID=A0A2S4L7N7_9HYPO|nr:Phenol 2-monooxygenase [Tolypocladium paradoxum]